MKAFQIFLILALIGCGDSKKDEAQTSNTSGSERSKGLTGTEGNSGLCNAGDNVEVSEYDTSGDDVPDVRRVFKRIGEDSYQRLVLVCRESDLNADGRKDVVRFYNDEGRPMREESDRNFDGQMDTAFYFQEGKIVRQENDESGDGRVDTKIYYDKGVPVRAEKDSRTGPNITDFKADRFEYYEGGRTVRMGVDFDGDGKVDRWDRDLEWSEQQRLAMEQEQNAPPSE